MIINGKILRKALKNADLTQELAAERLGVSRQTVNVWLKSDQLSLSIIENVKTILGIDLDKVGNIFNAPDVEYESIDRRKDGVYIYDVDFSANKIADILADGHLSSRIGYLNIPEVSGCDILIRAKGDSMKPRINDGDLLGLKKVVNWKEWLPMGYIYAIDTDQGQLIKYIKKGSTEDNYTIESENKHFEIDTIPKKVINVIWAVKTIIPFAKIETLI